MRFTSCPLQARNINIQTITVDSLLGSFSGSLTGPARRLWGRPSGPSWHHSSCASCHWQDVRIGGTAQPHLLQRGQALAPHPTTNRSVKMPRSLAQHKMAIQGSVVTTILPIAARASALAPHPTTNRSSTSNNKSKCTNAKIPRPNTKLPSQSPY
jgi:hypothetical protein